MTFLAIQLGLPLSRLSATFLRSEPQMQRFGWHMFASIRLPGVYEVQVAGDTVRRVDAGDFVIRERPELPLLARLPEHLCNRIDGAQAVRYGVYGEARRRILTCR